MVNPDLISLFPALTVHSTKLLL